ncbi:MAG TPA: penicillin-binding protein activator [Rickettsia endosymbiont of Sericostoma sp.]|uniref:penicillin-binding protein activator n=1 Tax=unclassified Candidatus Tisiphia TaxID=2996318 RepID=UPI001DBC3946|nr:penicillin-binding protein activator [Rickettsia endosymbiont of Sericostoma sp. HW-2014]HJD64539.1 penicillin-binding protein activator [Rickettsia endosymbiont of Sericostoma sp.]
MNSIKQKFLNITLSFICLVSLFSCQSNKEPIVTPTTKEVVQETLEVAILMPLTGENSTLGRQYNQLIKMGLEDGLKTYVHVTSYDGSNEQQVLAAMDKILARKTKIILGPLYSNLTSLIANKAKTHNIFIITMSNNPVLADQKLLVFGHAPSKQLTKIINYFADNDYKNFIALLPSGRHAQTTNQLIQNILIQKNSTLVRSEFYANIPESIEKAVLTVSNTVDNLNEMEDTETKPVIYLSDDGKNLNLLFDSIHKHNLDKKAIIIGDNRINIDYSEPVDIIFTGSLNIVNSNIIERAKNIGINHLSFMHAVAYDLGKITSKYIDTNFTEERFLAALNSTAPYIGISGNIHFIDSIAQREYDIIKKENGLYSTISKSADGF